MHVIVETQKKTIRLLHSLILLLSVFFPGSFEGVDLNGINEGALCENVERDFKPYVGQEFVSVEEAAKFYNIYGIGSGFGTRKYTAKHWRDGSLKSKLIVCNRVGSYYAKKNPSKEDGSVETIGRITSVLNVDCKARIRLFCLNGKFTVDEFIEEHNHELLSVQEREFKKLASNLTDYHKNFIVSNIRLKIGATKTYRMIKEHVNGFSNVGATLNQFKNFQRDLKCFIHEKDGQLFVDRFKSMADNRSGFFFDFDVDADGSLRRAIWADAEAIRNYEVFGDALSFDPTYSTNKYSMIFTPFTGVDNHKRTITFSGALIANEDYESFNWVFDRFLKAMGGKEPEYIITDQDPAIIKSVGHIFKRSRHRFCMWHIMNKVPLKFGGASSDLTEFVRKLNGIVWDAEIGAADFDCRWLEIMNEHGVGKGDWFEECFSIRRQWIMAHCRDLRMGSVLRTTQRSESSNSFFKKFEHKSGTLVEFWLRFESAIEQQRHNKYILDTKDRHSTPTTMITKSKIEEYGAKVYTHKIFQEFQEEVRCSISNCIVRGYREEDGEQITTLKGSANDIVIDVHYNPVTSEMRCSCTLYERKGLPCRHILWLCTCHAIEKIPSSLLARRWLKQEVFEIGEGVQQLQLSSGRNQDGRQSEMTKLWAEINETVAFVQRGDLPNVIELCENLKKFREEHESCGETVTKDQEFENLLGCKVISEVSILPPKQSKNKGSGKRMLSSKNVAVAVASKQKRMCKNCKQLANHDKRNCPFPFVED